MEISEITLHNENGIQKPIFNIEWYSEQFICYTYNKQLEIALWDHCITLDCQGKIVKPKDVGSSEVISFNDNITEIVPPDQLNSFINKFMEGQTTDVKN
tara:strand:- start:395 stop:691 length:297 start_codon:yes stop_codon:yes gene_type:complete